MTRLRAILAAAAILAASTASAKDVDIQGVWLRHPFLEAISKLSDHGYVCWRVPPGTARCGGKEMDVWLTMSEENPSRVAVMSVSWVGHWGPDLERGMVEDLRLRPEPSGVANMYLTEHDDLAFVMLRPNSLDIMLTAKDLTMRTARP